MTESEYLYGINVNEFLDMPYKQAIEYKLKTGRELHSELYGKEETHEDRVRIFKVYNAIRHNERLIKEWA
jgi:hypothetical protein